MQELFSRSCKMILQWFYSFWKRALALITPKDTCVSHFIKGFDMYMESMIKEAKNWENKQVCTINDYLQPCQETFAVQASISFLSFGLELPEEVLLHPIMQTVTLTSMDILLIINVSLEFGRVCKLTDIFVSQDMYSYSIELSWEGTYKINLVTQITF